MESLLLDLDLYLSGLSSGALMTLSVLGPIAVFAPIWGVFHTLTRQTA